MPDRSAEDTSSGVERQASGSWLSLESVHKSFGGVRALRGANLTLRDAGTVHGLIGENGSGKSTLLGVLSGQLRPDRGRILLDGQSLDFHSPASALRRGIVMVAQETALALDITIAENIFLGRRMVRGRTGINWAATSRDARKVLARLELDYNPEVVVRRLRPDQRQMVEIARALSLDARLLVLDEPTSSLTDDEVEALFNAIRHVKTHGVSTIFVSHRLNETFAITDEVTVLRDGVTAATGPTDEFDSHSLVDAMIGRADACRPSSSRTVTSRNGVAPPALDVRELSVRGLLHDINLRVGAGEIVGVAGLVGAGRSELLEAIFGVRPVTHGQIAVGGKALTIKTPRDAIKRGMGFLPPDRKVQGLMLRRTVSENVNIVRTAFVGRLRMPDAGANARVVEEISAAMRIRAASPQAPVSFLSGGNQQKVALGKWLAARPMMLLLDEPTRGVDVSAKAEIHELLRVAADQGMGLLISSSENSELLELADRVDVMFRGRIVASLAAGDASEALLARYAGGHV